MTPKTRRSPRLRALCFDLDNTLWDVWPVIRRAEQAMYDFLALRYPRVVARLTLEMMRVGQKNGPLNFSSADALQLPFQNRSFDAVVSGFLMRNVIDLQKALQEQYRVLRNGGRMVILDTTRPKKNILSPFIWLHMHFVIPTLGKLLTGSSEAYRYLPETTEGFVTAEEMAARMAAAFSSFGKSTKRGKLWRPPH